MSGSPAYNIATARRPPGERFLRHYHPRLLRRTLHGPALLAAVVAGGCAGAGKPEAERAMELTHEQTLKWIQDNNAWRPARKVKPILVRAVGKDEIGKAFQTADRAVERAQEEFALCVGVAGEPWFQKMDRVVARYDLAGEREEQFPFDTERYTYKVYRPKDNVRNWVAQVKGEWQGRPIAGFTIRPKYDMDHPLYAPAGGYVVRDDAPDPNADSQAGVWLVQQALFESTYELLP